MATALLAISGAASAHLGGLTPPGQYGDNGRRKFTAPAPRSGGAGQGLRPVQARLERDTHFSIYF
jgi:hypothetical protein